MIPSQEIARLSTQIDALILSVNRVQRVVEEVIFKQATELTNIKEREIYHTDRLNEFAIQVLDLSKKVEEIKKKLDEK